MCDNKSKDRVHHLIGLAEDVLIEKADHMATMLLKLLCPHIIVKNFLVGAMGITIHFRHDTRLGTKKVRIERPQRCLPAKAESRELLAA